MKKNKRKLVPLICLSVISAACTTQKTVERIPWETPATTLDLVWYYAGDCSPITLSTKVDGKRLAVEKLPYKKEYYLDGKYTSPVQCAYMKCQEYYKGETNVDLVKHLNVWSRPAPSWDLDVENLPTIPMYVTRRIEGEVKIEAAYFSDESCQKRKVYTEVVTVE